MDENKTMTLNESDTTYTMDDETEYTLVYDIPDNADEGHTVWMETPDGEDKVGVELSEFRAEWSEYTEDDPDAVKYERARARNGWGTQ